MRDVQLDAGGVVYTLRFSFNAICDIEKETGKPIAEVLGFGEGETPSMNLVRLLVKAGLSENHEGMDDRKAGNVIDAAGLENAMASVEEALLAAFPQGEDEGNGKKGKAKATG